MESLKIPCPQCGRALKINDRSLLGRKGKCPACQHVFVLAEPDEVEFELAEASTPAMGTGARWVPDEAPSAAPDPPQSAVDFTPPPSDELEQLASVAAPDGGVARLREIRRKNAKRRNTTLIVTAATVLLVAATTYFFLRPALTDGSQQQPPPPAGPLTDAGSPEDQAAPPRPAGGRRVATASPTDGDPVSLQFIPFGSRVVINLRPAELWQPNSLGEEFRYCLGPLGEWVESRLTELCRHKPAEIEECLICLIPGPVRGSEPDVCVVTHLQEEAKKSDLLEKFQGERIDDYGHPVYVSDGRAYLIHDLKTIAMCPTSMAQEMVDAAVAAHPASPGIDELISLTDRQRHLTVMFEPRQARIDAEQLVPPNALTLFNLFLDWFGDDVETVAWSLHIDEEEGFYSDVLLRNQLVVRPSRLQQIVRTKLDALPLEVLGAVEKMNPQEMGKRRIIGRFPAMTKAFSLATVATNGTRHVELITPLPERAAPNLALGTLLAWDESTRTDFSKEAPRPPVSGEKIPERIADRFQQKIDVDFRRTPLQEAFDYIAEETKAPIEIDGDALKLAGYTKNMPQTFAMENVPATKALYEIIKKYDKMCIVVDEQAKQATVMTLSVAEAKGLKPFPLDQ